ncbi:MAG: EamA family transporter [Hyphomicrobiales bacterium]
MIPVTRPAPLRVVIAFACIYLIWGSTYLAIRFAIETIPPFLMVGSRYLIAGALLTGWAVARGEARRPTARQAGAAALLGALFFLAGNGGVVFAETRITSGLAALLVAAIPIWVALIDWLRPGGVRPTVATVIGVLIGFSGVWLLIGAHGAWASERVDPVAAGVLLVTTFCWATGTVLIGRLPLVRSHVQSGGLQMLAGGALLLGVGLGTGELSRFRAAAVTLRSLLAEGYLIVAGSLVAFTAYTWLLRVTTPSRASTYAYVNPAIAVFLGWSLGGEPVGPRILVAGAVITAGVALIITARTLRRS